MPIQNNLVAEYTILNSGGTVSLPVTDPYVLYKFKSNGSTIMTNNYVIESSGTPSLGDEFRIWLSNVDLDITTNATEIYIFGSQIYQFLLNGVTDLYIISIYNGTSWDTIVNVDFSKQTFIDGAQINFQTIENSNLKRDIIDNSLIDDEAVTVDSISTSLREEIMTFPISFESGFQGNNTITIPYNFTLNKITTCVTKVISGADNGSITPLINDVATTPSSISISAASPLNTIVTTNLVSGNDGNANQTIKLITSKLTPGGELLVTLSLSRR
jgi:hypothetical protein